MHIIGKCCIIEIKLWKVWLKYIRDLGTVSPVTMVNADVCFNVRNLI